MSSRDFERMNWSAPNLMVVCVDARDGNDSRGRLYDCYHKEEQRFENEYQLIKMMECLMDDLDYPQSAVELRVYCPKPVSAEKGQKPKKLQEQRELLQYRGNLATFVIYVQYRQNATWQGDIGWAERNTICSFRSVLEMLKLMDNAQEK